MSKKRMIIWGVVALAAVIIFGFYKYNFVSGTWRYKITVAVETPEGIKEGSAVREISNTAAKKELIDLPEAGNPATERGEAVVVDLGERGKLFALINWNSEQELYYAFPYNDNRGGQTSYNGVVFYNSIPVGAKATLTKYIPKMVTFKDPADPQSVALVYDWQHDKIIDNFEAVFGQGVRLKEVTIERTDEPVTRKLDKLFPEYVEILSMTDSIRFDLKGE